MWRIRSAMTYLFDWIPYHIVRQRRSRFAHNQTAIRCSGLASLPASSLDHGYRSYGSYNPAFLQYHRRSCRGLLLLPRVARKGKRFARENGRSSRM